LARNLKSTRSAATIPATTFYSSENQQAPFRHLFSNISVIKKKMKHLVWVYSKWSQWTCIHYPTAALFHRDLVVVSAYQHAISYCFENNQSATLLSGHLIIYNL